LRGCQGAFYGFEEIYDLSRLDYHGPPFGWWDITDQFALARMDALESSRNAGRCSSSDDLYSRALHAGAAVQEDWTHLAESVRESRARPCMVGT
jgi:hypothetical protein